MNSAAGPEFFDWYREHATSVSEMWAGTPLLSEFLRRFLPLIGAGQEEAVERYFQSHIPPEAAHGVSQGLESLRLVSRLRRTVHRRSGAGGR